jgi:hypothetical protein
MAGAKITERREQKITERGTKHKWTAQEKIPKNVQHLIFCCVLFRIPFAASGRIVPCTDINY